MFLICQMVSALWWSNNQNRWRGYISKPHPLFFQTKRGLTLEALKRKIHERFRLQPLDQVYNISFQYPQLIGRGMLKFVAVQLVDNRDVKGMIFFIGHTKILQCYEFYANIKCNTFPTLNPEPRTSTSSTTILSLIPLFTHIWCNPRHFCFNPARTKYS